MSIYIWVYQNMASPKNWLIPKLYQHFVSSIHVYLSYCDSDQHCNSQVFVRVCAPSHSCRNSPYFTGPALRASTLQPMASTGEGRALPLSPCRNDPSILCCWGMTDTEPIHRNDQDPIKQLKNMPDVSSLFTERAMQFEGICNYCSLWKWEF